MLPGKMTHGFVIDSNRCQGTMSCMRACPTHAIRVKERKAHLLPEHCIDCGSCLSLCPNGAISAATLSFEELDIFKFKVAVPSPVLFTQFAKTDTPDLVGRALLDLGFDAVWDYSVDIELINRAIRDCMRNWSGPFPLISSSCPVVVRLVQVAYPTMVEQLLPIDAPREIAGREIKRKYSKKLGLKPEEIAAIYISPCQAKTISILEPAEEVKSYLDGAVGISDIYNDILFTIRRIEDGKVPPRRIFGSDEIFRWGNPEGEFHNLSNTHYLPLTGLTDIISVFDDIEKGKIRNIEFLECHACQGGCIGGNLTVENIYVARAKKMHLIATVPPSTKEFEEEVERRYGTDDFALRAPLKPRILDDGVLDLRERVWRKKRANDIMNILPALNCGLCGAPRCKDHAEDVAAQKADLKDCVFVSEDRIKDLKKYYFD
jgi:Na+-translocating ferredoxin:NAD+ oxidoreductase RNF subunit RnfB